MDKLCDDKLLRACEQGKHEVVDALLEAGADAKVCSMPGMITPLHLAKNIIIAEKLLSCGADVNARDSSGSTPLHSLCKRLEGGGWLLDDHINLLIDAGADVNAKDDQDLTPLNYSKNGTVRAVLQSRGARETEHVPLTEKHVLRTLRGEWQHMWQTQTVHIGVANSWLLHRASEIGDVGLMNFAMSESNRFDPSFRIERMLEVKNGRQRSALQAACENGFHEAVAVLLSHGADVQHVINSDTEETLLDWVMKKGTPEVKEALRVG